MNPNTLRRSSESPDDRLRQEMAKMEGPVEELGARTVLLGDERRRVEGIYGNRQEQRILATSTGLGFDEYNMVGVDNVRDFVDKYPTPMDFADTSEHFLQMIRDNNPEQKYQEYLQSMDSFQRKIYGRKYSYYLASKEEQGSQDERLHGRYEATEVGPQPAEHEKSLGIGERLKGFFKRKREEQPAISEVVPVTDPVDRIERRGKTLEQSGELRELSKAESREMFARAVMEGAPLYDEMGRAKTYTREDLRKAELEPKYGMELEGVRFGFSEAFKLGSRDAVIGYVSKGNSGAYVRGYYRSNSQGVWRYLPDRQQDAKGAVTWYGKGQSEEAITLPSEVQAYLNKVSDRKFDNKMSRAELAKQKEYSRALVDEAMSSQTRPQSYMDKIDRSGFSNKMDPAELAKMKYWAFFGTAGQVKNGGSDYYQARKDGRTQDALSREVSAEARFSYDVHRPPEQMRLKSEIAPDFDQEVASYSAHSDKYGNYTARTFMSREGGLKWTIMEDEQGRAWVGQVETSAPITSTGLRSQWVHAGDFATPVYEYDSQDEGYGDYSDRKGNYVSMWRNYLSRIPMIQEYKAKQLEERSA